MRPTDRKDSISDNSAFIFFVLPFVFLFVIALTGYEIFYNGNRIDTRKVLLLSLGSLFYLILLIILFIK